MGGSIITCEIFSSAITSGLQAYAQQYLSAFKATTILMLEPVFTACFASFILGEVLLPQCYIGACIILGAIPIPSENTGACFLKVCSERVWGN